MHHLYRHWNLSNMRKDAIYVSGERFVEMHKREDIFNKISEDFYS